MKKAAEKRSRKGGGAVEVSLLAKFRAGMLSAYYGKPVLDLKLVVLVGEQATLAGRMIYAAMTAAGRKTAVFTEVGKPKMAVVHKFLSDAWKAGATYAVVAVPRRGLDAEAFYGLPVKVLGVFDADLAVGERELEEFCKSKPEMTVLVDTEADELVDKMMDFVPDEKLLGYGRATGATVRLINYKSYKRGAEVKLACGPEYFTVATLETLGGETDKLARVLAGVAAVLMELGLGVETVIEGVAEYEG